MALKVFLKQDQNSPAGEVFLRERDIKSIAFGVENAKNPVYDKDAVDSEDLIDKSVLQEYVPVEYCKITFYELIEQEVPYKSITKRAGKDVEVIKTKKETVNNYWAVFDKAQFPYLREYCESMA